MKKVLMIAATAIIASAVSASANASSTQAQLALCAATLDARGVANASDYRPKFRGVRGGGTKRLSLEMIPTIEDEDPIAATCTIKRGRVVSLSIDGEDDDIALLD